MAAMAAVTRSHSAAQRERKNGERAQTNESDSAASDCGPRIIPGRRATLGGATLGGATQPDVVGAAGTPCVQRAAGRGGVSAVSARPRPRPALKAQGNQTRGPARCGADQTQTARSAAPPRPNPARQAQAGRVRCVVLAPRLNGPARYTRHIDQTR